VARRVRSVVEPRSLVIVGASPRRPGPILGALRGQVPVWGVNPSRTEVLGVPCFPSVRDLPELPETAVVLVSHERIEDALAEAVAVGIRSFVVPGLGSEAGGQAKAIIERVTELVASVDGTMLGPNCMGFAVPDGASPWLAPIPVSFIGGHIAVVTQSGSVGEAMVSLGPRVGFRAVVSCGGEADLGIAEFLDFFAADERTRAVGLFIETVRRPAAFAAALGRCAEAGKPVVCLKVGSSEAAARVALAHTGALVGSSRAFSALVRRTGAIQVDDVPELVETLEVLGCRRWPRGIRVGAVSESGGEAALLADHGEQNGLQFSPLPEVVREALALEFPALTAPQNPIDAWAAAEPERIYPRTLELLARSGAYDVLVAQVDLSRFRSASDHGWNRLIIEALGEVADAAGLFAATTTVHTTDPPDWAPDLARALDVALLRGPSDATAAIARVAGWRARVPDRPACGASIEVADLMTGDGPLPEYESAAILERYGVSFAPRVRARSPAEAGAAARDLGTPVVVKRDGPAHKARSGGVRLGVETPEAAAAAADELGGAVLVAKQAPPGAEVFCGGLRDPDYGPVLAVGPGGADVETSASVLAMVGPLSAADAAFLVSEAKLPDPHGQVARAVEAVSRLMHEHPEVVEVDINPVICGLDESVAVDALVVVEPRSAV
jgi:acetate---CoA ligase (ADP-forming)